MDSPPLPPQTPTATSSPPPPPQKIRLMCSYGGHIFPRPQTKTLHYLGGETRIISLPIPTATASISDFISHIAAALRHNNEDDDDQPFYLKYQLPHHELDSLISLSTDDDLNVMIDEHHKLLSQSSRIRLFVFNAKHGERLDSGFNEEESSRRRRMKVLQHPKTEAWFVDALKSARIMEGMQSEGEFGAGLYTQESMALETSSSFGSTASSSSLSNLPAKSGNFDDNAASDYGVGSSVTHPQFVNYQEPTIPAAMLENKVSSNSFESESHFSNSPSGIQVRQPVQFSGYQMVHQVNHHYQQQQQPFQFVQMPPNYITQNPTGLVPVQSYYPTYETMQHQQLHYQPNQSYPVYLVPAPQPQPQTYNIPTQYRMADPVNIGPLRPPVHPSATLLSHRVYKETAPAIESSAQIYRSTTPSAVGPVIHVPYNENQQPSVIQNKPQPTGAINEVDDVAARAQIYKSQPPPPVVPSSHNQTMTRATAILLSEAMAQLHVEHVNQAAAENVLNKSCLVVLHAV
ncbi:hypothetical protein ACFE04_006870 [Oxalis oulophora]